MKKITALLLAALLTVGLTGCAQEKASGEGDNSTGDDKTIVIGASATPHKDIIDVAIPLLEEKGYKVEVEVFQDYVLPNTALAEGDIDANFFQHVPYLENMASEQDLDITWTAKVHIEPMGVYSDKITEIAELKEGAEIAIPNDASNGARALLLLEKAGLITLKDVEQPSILDIDENAKNIKFTELDAPQLPRALQDVDAAVINTNYALEADLNPLEDALFIETSDSPYANVIAVKTEDKDSEKIKDLSEAMNSEAVRKYIEDTYKGSIVPAF